MPGDEGHRQLGNADCLRLRTQFGIKRIRNSDPLFSTGPHPERSFLCSVAPGSNSDVRGSSNLSAQCDT
jgi:hypothetical protein